jgi:hypothetical protein
MARHHRQGDDDQGRSDQSRKAAQARARQLAQRDKDNAAAKVRRDRGKPKPGQ